MKCLQCGAAEMIATQQNARVSAGGIVGALVGLVGIVTMLANLPLGVLVLIAGMLIGSISRRKVLYMICPSCKARQRI